MDSINVQELVERLGSDEVAVHKMAVFKLQSIIGDPSFADVFILEGGLTKLRYMALHASGNTLAYCLTSLSRLLETDKGWEYVDRALVERVVELVVTHPLVNILRGAMSILVYIVSHPYTASNKISQPDSFGFRALKPAIAVYPQFLEMLVSRLSSADHALCSNALLLINSLMRETITNDSASDWPKFVKRLQDLGVIKIVYTLIQSTALQDLSHPLLEFQALTKVLLRKWRDIPVDLGNSDHRRAMKSIQLASNPQTVATDVENGDDKGKKKNSLEKWRRLGFECDRPEWEFEETGYLGMMDLTDYVKNDEDGFHKLLLEQSSKPAEKRCPIARASIAVTAILYEHFEVEKADVDDAKVHLAFESRSNFDKVHTPMILKWPIVHTAGLQAFLRLWQTTGAELEDFMRIVELVRILLEAVVGGATRTTDIHEVETSIAEFELQRLRKLQMEYLEVTYEDTWGHHLRQTRDGLKHEALQFIKEQRIRCLLAGAWFPNFIHKPDPGVVTKQDLRYSNPDSYRYVKLSRNRKWLRYADFDSRGNDEPALEDLHESVDLNAILTVTSDITSTSDASSSTSTLKVQNPTPYTKITINGLPPFESRSTTPNPHARPGSLPSRNTDAFPRRDVVLLTLHPQTPSLASEWLDGLLMLLGQKPITAETNKLITMIKDYGLKIRLLNVDLTNMHLADDVPEIPSREGLDDNYYYDVIEG